MKTLFILQDLTEFDRRNKRTSLANTHPFLSPFIFCLYNKFFPNYHTSNEILSEGTCTQILPLHPLKPSPNDALFMYAPL